MDFLPDYDVQLKRVISRLFILIEIPFSEL